MLALWDTSGTEVVRKLAAERRAAGGVTSGLALTLVAVTDEPRVRAVEDAVTVAAAEHPCRLLVAVRDPLAGEADAPSRLDAEIIVGGRLGPCEAVVLRMWGRLALHAESVVVPLLAPDVPVVTWWHATPPDRIAYDPLGVVAERRVTDAAQCADPVAALRQRADDYAPGDTDLAWSRITPWRTLVAGAFDTITAPAVSAKGAAAAMSAEVTAAVMSAEVTAADGDAGAFLLTGWLCARLGIPPDMVTAVDTATPPTPARPGTGLRGVVLRLADGGEVAVTRPDGNAVLRRTGHPEQVLPLVPRRLGDELAEELRRLDPDQPYAEALSAATGVAGLHLRPASRVHIWHDPALAEQPDPAGAGTS
jgi:glucose-6-phosphate dehydrogenase assembly protein OpcA